MAKKVVSILPARGLEAVYLDDDQTELTESVQALVFWQDTEKKEDKDFVNIRIVTAEDVSMGFVMLEEGTAEPRNFKEVREKSTGTCVSEATLIEGQLKVQPVK